VAWLVRNGSFFNTEHITSPSSLPSPFYYYYYYHYYYYYYYYYYYQMSLSVPHGESG